MQLEQPWRRLPYSLGDSERHIALSNALVRLARMPTVWWHATTQPTLILGTGQRIEDFGSRPSDHGGPSIVRRHTGGTAVLAAAGVLGLDIALPAAHPLAGSDVVEAYRWLGQTWAAALRDFQIETHIVSIAEARESSHEEIPAMVRMACFGTLSPYEITAGGKKLVGFAQVRRRTGVLLQSGIHLRFDALGLASLLSREDAASIASGLRARAVGLDEVAAGRPNEIDVIRAFEQALEDRGDIRLTSGDWEPDELDLANPPR